MVYEYLPRLALTLIKAAIKLPPELLALPSSHSIVQLELITTWSPLDILFTCRSIRTEAQKLLEARLRCPYRENAVEKMYRRPRLIAHIADTDSTSIGNSSRAAQEILGVVLSCSRTHPSLDADPVIQSWIR